MSIRTFFTKQTILGVLLFSSISAWAQPRLELQSVIEAATERDPWLGQSSYKQDALMEESVAEGALPDPRVTVAGLLHDIGKTYTYDTWGKPTATARLCDHADMTLEACAYGLAYLDKVDPDAALALRHIWTCASPGARYGVSPAMTLARYVRDADAQSAMADNQRKAYRKRQPIGFGRLGNNTYWRPSIEAHG